MTSFTIELWMMRVGSRYLLVCLCVVWSLVFESPGIGAEPETENVPDWEQLFLLSGEELLGRSLVVHEGLLVWQQKDGETLHIPLDQIQQLSLLPESPEIPPTPELTDSDEVINGEEEESWTDLVPLGETFQQTYETATVTAVKWTQRIQVGGQLNHGNTNTSLIDVTSILEQNTKEKMRQIDIGGQWGRNNSVQTANRWWINTNFDWPVYQKWITFVTSKNEYNDPAHLNYRGTISTGTGYRFIYEDQRRLIVRFGPAYTIEVFRSPSNTRNTPDLFGEVEIKTPLWKRASLDQKMRVQPSLFNSELIRVFSTTGLNFDLDEADRWKLRIGLQYQYISQPNPGRVPTDLMSTLSLVYQRK